MQALSGYTRALRGVGHVPAELGHELDEVFARPAIAGQLEQLAIGEVRNRTAGQPRTDGYGDVLGQRFELDPRTVTHGKCAFDSVFELAHVARPIVANQRIEGLGREAFGRGQPAHSMTLEEERGEYRDIVLALAQWWQPYPDHVETVVEVLSEVPALDSHFEVGVGRGDYPDVDPSLAGISNPPDHALLEDPVEFDLHRQRQVAELVEKQRSAVGLFEQAKTVSGRACEAAPDVPEQLALDQLFGDHSAVDRDEGGGRRIIDPMTMRRDLARTWERILAWHRGNGAVTFELAEGARVETIARVEKAMGVALPDDVRVSWELHDGGRTESAWILSQGDLLSMEKVGSLWTVNQNMQAADGWGLGDDYRPERRDPKMKPIWWSPARIPLTDNGGSGLHVDLDPTWAGIRGQILEMDHEIGPERVLAPSWSAFLETWADDLEAGKYAYDPDAGWVTEQAMLPDPVLRRKLVHPSGAVCVVELAGEWLSISEVSPTGEAIVQSSAPSLDAARKQLRAEVARRLARGWTEALGG